MKFRGGHNVLLQGKPEGTVQTMPDPETLYLPLKSERFQFIEICVDEGQEVKAGDTLATDPENFDVPLLAPRAGAVRLEQVENHIVLEHIETAGKRDEANGRDILHAEQKSGTAAAKRQALVQLGAWQFVYDAHTGALPDPSGTPQAVIVSTACLEPFVARGDALLQALRQGRLAPGLFLSYAVIGFARGLRCCGGVFQTDYMTRMRGGLAEALLAHGAASEARAVSAVAVDNFIAGPEVAFLEGHDGLRAAGPRPAGLIELAARGGLDRAALEAAGRLTLRQGLLAGLVDLAEEFVPPEQRPRGWRDDVARWLKEQPGVVLV